MDIYIGADHRGYNLKNQLKEWLIAEEHTVYDIGALELNEGDDYPDYGLKVAEAVAKEPESNFGVAICGSGVGVAVAANKVRGIRAGSISTPEVARAARHDDRINVLALGADFVTFEQAQAIVRACLETEPSQELKHQTRIDEISAYEQKQNN